MEILKILEVVFGAGQKFFAYSKTRRELSICNAALTECDANLVGYRRQAQLAMGLIFVMVVTVFIFSRYYTIVPRS